MTDVSAEVMVEETNQVAEENFSEKVLEELSIQGEPDIVDVDEFLGQDMKVEFPDGETALDTSILDDSILDIPVDNLEIEDDLGEAAMVTEVLEDVLVDETLNDLSPEDTENLAEKINGEALNLSDDLAVDDFEHELIEEEAEKLSLEMEMQETEVLDLEETEDVELTSEEQQTIEKVSTELNSLEEDVLLDVEEPAVDHFQKEVVESHEMLTPLKAVEKEIVSRLCTLEGEAYLKELKFQELLEMRNLVKSFD